MNHDDLIITAVREQRDKIPMTIPEEQIISRGRALRARRRIPGVAGGLAVLAVASLATAGLVSGHQTGSPATTQLAAWTVSDTGNGTILVTVRELRDQAALQAKLRAEGLPVNVSFSGPPRSSVCQPADASKATLGPVAEVRGSGTSRDLVFHLSAIPAGDGVALFVNNNLSSTANATQSGVAIAVSLVTASPACTGTSG